MFSKFKKVVLLLKLRKFIKSFDCAKWNEVVAGALLETFMKGKKHYVTLEDFISEHYPDQELTMLVESLKITYCELIQLQKYPSAEQLKLEHVCATRKINNPVIDLIRAQKAH